MSEILLPPWVLPQSESSTLVDDTTSVFRPNYAPGAAQRAQYVEPRLQVKQGFKSLRGFERGAMFAALARAQGKFNTIRAAVGYANRGSFPTTELVADPTFASGISYVFQDGNAQYSLVGQDHGIRATRNSVNTGSASTYQGWTGLIGVPYVLRGFVVAGRGNIPLLLEDFADPANVGAANALTSGMLVASVVATQTAQNISFYDFNVANFLPGDYWDAKFLSATRCALVDGGQNILPVSDTPGVGTGWQAVSSQTVPGNYKAPDGNIATYFLLEDTSNGPHYFAAASTGIAAAGWVSFGAWIAPLNRNWAWLQITDGISGGNAFFDVLNGVVGVINNGSTITMGRSTIQRYNNGWCYCTYTAYKTSGVLTVQTYTGPAPGNGVQSYTGTNSTYATAYWRMSVSLNGVPARPAKTVGSPSPAVAQTGNGLYLKGLPPATSGLLLEGDLFEINGELKMATSALDSDAAGRGYVVFTPGMFRAANDNDPVIISKPFGKFILADNASWDNQFGAYADIDISLEAIAE